MSQFSSSVCGCSTTIKDYDTKFLRHVHVMLSEVYKARDEDNFCAVTALLMVDIIRYIIISHSEIDGPEQIQSARDVLRIYPDIERMLLSKGESHAIN